MNTQTHTLDYGTTTIEYSLNFADRQTLGITVHPDCSVSVTAPKGSSLETIEEKLRKRRSWILKQQLDFERYLPHLPARRYISGETHLYLGKQYRLKVNVSPNRSVKLTRGYFIVETPDPSDTSTVKKQMSIWYRSNAKRVFMQQLTQCMSRVQVIGITNQPELHIKQMQKRWGSCTSDGLITLNLKLIQVPKHLIDYIIIHELCHIKEYNHSPAYYQLLDRVMPDWRERREALNLVKVG
ncbi:MAG: M48 family metallopeptidase [Caldilineaceae bacterium]|nr:M48 family metallopeptidase [Caldilineaceae bacterium]